MTREQIELDYHVVDGRIMSPGCFEGELVYVPFYWSIYMGGCADRDDGRIIGFDIRKEDRAMFPELGRLRRTVKLYQRDDGFICEA